ncbi:DUF6243 family protein [Streptomyces sp. NPDC059010]|uniref:DUF6243 family protein n=1 Tax=Streptomyces sp. NPDC059010 TaxID=3346695 RepID=UPI0036948C85
MARSGAGNMLGVGGTRHNLGRNAMRGGSRGNRIGGGTDPTAQKRELLRKLQERRAEEGEGEARAGAQDEETS